MFKCSTTISHENISRDETKKNYKNKTENSIQAEFSSECESIERLSEH